MSALKDNAMTDIDLNSGDGVGLISEASINQINKSVSPNQLQPSEQKATNVKYSKDINLWDLNNQPETSIDCSSVITMLE